MTERGSIAADPDPERIKNIARSYGYFSSRPGWRGLKLRETLFKMADSGELDFVGYSGWGVAIFRAPGDTRPLEVVITHPAKKRRGRKTNP